MDIEQKIKNIESYINNTQLANVAQLNEDAKKFKNFELTLIKFADEIATQIGIERTFLEEKLGVLKEEVKKDNNAQITINQLFAKNIENLEAKIKSLETSKVSITPNYVPTAFNKTSKKWFWQK